MNIAKSLTSIYQNNAVRATALAVTTAFSSGCTMFQDEGRVIGAGIGGLVGSVLTEDSGRTTNRAGTAAGAAIGGVLGGVFADRTTTCRDESTTKRQGTRNNRTGEVTSDTSTTRAETKCEGGRTDQPNTSSGSPVNNQPVF